MVNLLDSMDNVDAHVMVHILDHIVKYFPHVLMVLMDKDASMVEQ